MTEPPDPSELDLAAERLLDEWHLNPAARERLRPEARRLAAARLARQHAQPGARRRKNRGN